MSCFNAVQTRSKVVSPFALDELLQFVLKDVLQLQRLIIGDCLSKSCPCLTVPGTTLLHCCTNRNAVTAIGLQKIECGQSKLFSWKYLLDNIGIHVFRLVFKRE